MQDEEATWHLKQIDVWEIGMPQNMFVRFPCGLWLDRACGLKRILLPRVAPACPDSTAATKLAVIWEG